MQGWPRARPTSLKASIKVGRNRRKKTRVNGESCKMRRRKEIIVGTRSSPLAVRQTEEVLTQLRSLNPGTEFVVTTIKTGGDRSADAPLVGLGRGVFVKEIEDSLLRGDIDLAVHSLKDLPTELPEKLTIGAVGERRDPRDVLVDRWDLPMEKLPSGARIGTSSPRRIAQLKAARQDLRVLPIRGNVDTRLRKARGDDYDGVILAAAGILRLGRQNEITQHLSPQEFVPAVGQGALAVEVRSEDKETLDIVSGVDHRPTSIAIAAERAFLAALGGGCAVPVAGHCQVDERKLRLVAMAGTEDGRHIFRVNLVTGTSHPEDAGRNLAQMLMDAGAGEILRVGTA